MGANHLLGSQSHRHYSPELDDFSNRRQGVHNQDMSTGGSIPAVQGDHMWTSGREIEAVGGMTFPPLYSQQFQQNPAYDVRHLSQYPMAQYGQPATNLSSVIGSSNPMLHSPNSFVSRSDTRGASRRDREGHGNDWNEHFQGLSLGQ